LFGNENHRQHAAAGEYRLVAKAVTRVPQLLLAGRSREIAYADVVVVVRVTPCGTLALSSPGPAGRAHAARRIRSSRPGVGAAGTAGRLKRVPACAFRPSGAVDALVLSRASSGADRAVGAGIAACAFAQSRGCAAWARRDCFCPRATAGPAIALARGCRRNDAVLAGDGLAPWRPRVAGRVVWRAWPRRGPFRPVRWRCGGRGAW